MHILQFWWPVMNVGKRGGHCHIRRRVPKRYHEVETRTAIRVGLHTDSESIARRKAGGSPAQMVEAWEQACRSHGRGRWALRCQKCWRHQGRRQATPKSRFHPRLASFRLERGKNFCKTARDVAASSGLDFGWHLEFVDGVAHDNALMALAAAPLIIEDAQARSRQVGKDWR